MSSPLLPEMSSRHLSTGPCLMLQIKGEAPSRRTIPPSLHEVGTPSLKAAPAHTVARQHLRFQCSLHPEILRLLGADLLIIKSSISCAVNSCSMPIDSSEYKRNTSTATEAQKDSHKQVKTSQERKLFKNGKLKYKIFLKHKKRGLNKKKERKMFHTGPACLGDSAWMPCHLKHVAG